ISSPSIAGLVLEYRDGRPPITHSPESCSRLPSRCLFDGVLAISFPHTSSAYSPPRVRGRGGVGKGGLAHSYSHARAGGSVWGWAFKSRTTQPRMATRPGGDNRGRWVL